MILEEWELYESAQIAWHMLEGFLDADCGSQISEADLAEEAMDIYREEHEDVDCQFSAGIQHAAKFLFAAQLRAYRKDRKPITPLIRIHFSVELNGR